MSRQKKAASSNRTGRASDQRRRDRVHEPGKAARRKPPRRQKNKEANTRAARSGKGRGQSVRGNPRFIGIVSAHPDGFGFVDVEGREKGIFLPQEQMRGLMHGDRVEVKLTRQRGRESGELVRIIEHAPNIIVGEVRLDGDLVYVQPRSKRMPQTILLSPRDARGCRPGEWVRVEIKRGSRPLRGRVIEKLGDKLTPADLIELVISELQLPTEFPPLALAEADRLPDEVAPEDMRGRRDLRNLPFVTIDGADARDFDDAICILPRGEGFEAWVAIADVAHYVRPNSALDKEALERSNSFYFPDRVIPMLPEKLSNGLCSLNPDVPRLAMAVRMRFDASGKRRAIQPFEAVIHSHARLTYDQASRWLDQRDAEAVSDARIRDMLDDAARLYRKLHQRRALRGALDLDVPEVRAVLHEGRVTDMSSSDRNTAHHLIEELMLAANTAIAEYFESRQSPLLYRVHPAPERESIEALNDYLAPFGLSIRLPASEKDRIRPGAIQEILEQAQGRPFAHVLHRLVLRSMQQARYTPENEGHFGLAYDSYCHFTSPIRRYADLTVHRRLKALLRGENPDRVQPAAGLAAIGEHASTQERKQQRGEWDIQAMLAALYHSKDVGKVMPARISGLTKRRIFLEIEDTLAEAALDVDALGGLFDLDDRNHRLVARRGGLAYSLGDAVNVRIEGTDPVRGQIHVSLIPDAV